jgi:hypothetical protein
VADGDGLENHCGGNVTVGSNPTPSALTRRYAVKRHCGPKVVPARRRQYENRLRTRRLSYLAPGKGGPRPPALPGIGANIGHERSGACNYAQLKDLGAS